MIACGTHWADVALTAVLVVGLPGGVGLFFVLLGKSLD